MTLYGYGQGRYGWPRYGGSTATAPVTAALACAITTSTAISGGKVYGSLLGTTIATQAGLAGTAGEAGAATAVIETFARETGLVGHTAHLATPITCQITFAAAVVYTAALRLDVQSVAHGDGSRTVGRRAGDWGVPGTRGGVWEQFPPAAVQEWSQPAPRGGSWEQPGVQEVASGPHRSE